MRFFPIKGSSTGSKLSGRFSMRTVLPRVMASSRVSMQFFWSSLTTTNCSPYFALIHFMPWSCNKSEDISTSKFHYIKLLAHIHIYHYISIDILIIYLWVNDERPTIRICENDSIFCGHSVRREPFIVPDGNGGIISEQLDGVQVMSDGNDRLQRKATINKVLLSWY